MCIYIHVCLCHHDVLFSLLACAKGDIRIVPFTTYSPSTGIIEVCNGTQGHWVTVCGNHFDDHDASVVCVQLGYSKYGMMHSLYYNYATHSVITSFITCIYSFKHTCTMYTCTCVYNV